MEEIRKIPAVGSSSSSFTSELFGSGDTSSPANEIFGSLFSSSSKVSEKDSQRLEVNGKMKEFSSKEKSCMIWQEQRAQPCHLSSSIYYGGQDFYSHPHQSTQNAGLNSNFKKDVGEDDSLSASRGNWWKGSLYY